MAKDQLSGAAARHYKRGNQKVAIKRKALQTIGIGRVNRQVPKKQIRVPLKTAGEEEGQAGEEEIEAEETEAGEGESDTGEEESA